MPGTLPSDRFNSGFKAGSSSDIARPITGQELIFLERVDEESRDEKVRVALLADIFTDLGFSLEGLTETVTLSTAAGGSVTLDIKDGLILSRVYGIGTEQDPYLVYTAADLNNVRADLDANYLQMADIDLTGIPWIPIGTFYGSYNGNGKTITGLTVYDDTPGSYGGLFGRTQDATLENITIVDCDIAATIVVGALCAIASDSSISGCIASGDLTLLGAGDCGGLIGETIKYLISSVITNCHANVNVNAPLANNVGGLIGNSFATISECSSRGEITGAGAAAGGLAGFYSGWSGTGIANSYSQVNISGTFGKVGGLLGQVDDYSDDETGNLEISNCYASGNLGSAADGKGGFAGYYEILYGITTTNCVWLQDTEINVGITDEQVAAHNAAWMQDKNSYTTSPWAWDFDSGTGIWAILPSAFPTLQVEA